MSQEARQYFRANCGYDLDQLRNTRYDLVIHMVTAAEGAERFYTLENNRARSESPQRAIEVDRLIRQQWSGHKNFKIVGNENDFNSKVNTVHKHILSQLCKPTSAIYPSKFLLGQNFSYDSLPSELHRHRFHESIFILEAPNSLPEWAESNSRDILSYLKIRRSLSEQKSIRLSHTFRVTSADKKMERKSPLSREEI